MSRAFVKEPDGTEADEMVELPIPEGRNFVTMRGLELIDAEITALNRTLDKARRAEDKNGLATAQRDMRYWAERKASAELVAVQPDTSQIRFGHRVTLENDSGTQKIFTLVGQDEADAAHGLLSFTAPVAVALIGKGVGDAVIIAEDEYEIMAVETA